VVIITDQWLTDPPKIWPVTQYELNVSWLWRLTDCDVCWRSFVVVGGLHVTNGRRQVISRDSFISTRRRTVPIRPNSISLAGRKPGCRLAWRARAGRRQIESTSRTRSKTVRCWRHKWPAIGSKAYTRSITTCWDRFSTLSTRFSTRKVLSLSWAGRRPGLAGREPGRKPEFLTRLSTC